MAAMKTPGVYIVEKNAFPNSVVEVPTAVPAFIGHTEKALDGSKSILNKPWRITSMADYLFYFGGGGAPKFDIATTSEGEEDHTLDDDNKIMVNGTPYYVKTVKNYSLYNHLRFFYANGGGPCYIVSVGNYDAALDAEKLNNGINALLNEQEPTLVLVPEAVDLSAAAECQKVQQQMLMHCGKMKNRFAIIDVFQGYKKRAGGADDIVTKFREAVGSNFLSFGTAYYPWLRTSVVSDKEISWKNTEVKNLKTMLKAEVATWPEERKTKIEAEIDKLPDSDNVNDAKYDELHGILLANCDTYKAALKAMMQTLNLLPPSAAMAGLYTMVDNTRGVWKAPANVSINSVVAPVVNVSHDDQEDLNVPMSGKAVNAIRTFTGEGVKVWGARTLDGNSLDWRYINVRRTMIFLEESVKNAAKSYVFEPNDANTWLNIKSMIENFLRGVWKRGGLAGAIPDDAYSVHVGLGETMTAEDILEGIMKITVLVAITHPAEFIEITFQQQMQKS